MGYNSIAIEKSFDFALRIIEVYKYLCQEKKEYILSKQLLKSGTSIGANIREALYAQSRKDFLNKMNIALKEAGETVYWIELLKKACYLDESHNSLYTDSQELCKILSSTVKTLKET